MNDPLIVYKYNKNIGEKRMKERNFKTTTTRKKNKGDKKDKKVKKDDKI
jgi:hypothetical protein